MKNKKGLSQIVTVVIIILLVIVAIGLVWGVVNGLLSNKSDQIKQQSKCMDINLKITKVITDGKASNGAQNYTVGIERTMGGSGTAATARIIFSNSTKSSNSTEFGAFTNPGDVITNTVSSNVLNATQVDVNSYITDDSGKVFFCGKTSKKL